MQYRLATALAMSFGATLAHLEKDGRITSEDGLHAIGVWHEFVTKLLEDETIGYNEGNTGYPPMKLSGDNSVAETYNEVVRNYAVIDNPTPSQMQGYKE